MPRRWPEWWDWELELTPHLRKRMLDRDFTEADLRMMFENIKGYKPDIVDGRWVIIAARRKRTWEVIVEPDSETKRLVVITAYPYSGS